jgi:hypothetical protein
MSKAVILIGIILILGIYLWFSSNNTNKPEIISSGNITSYTSSKGNYWDLMLYSTQTPDTTKKIDSIKGLATKEACIEEGIKRTKEAGSFECGYKCKEQQLKVGESKENYDLCEKVCDQGGCK